MDDSFGAFVIGLMGGVISCVIFFGAFNSLPYQIQNKLADKHCGSIESRIEYNKCVKDFLETK